METTQGWKAKPLKWLLLPFPLILCTGGLTFPPAPPFILAKPVSKSYTNAKNTTPKIHEDFVCLFVRTGEVFPPPVQSTAEEFGPVSL